MTYSDATRAELGAIRRVSVAEARALVDQGEGLLVDTRDRRLFDNAHAGGAASVPLAEIVAAPLEAVRGLPPARTLILYCA